MNSDDPKLTAYALDELDPTERAEIEQLLRENPDALAEVEETKTFVAQLRRELKTEAGTPLTEEQKATVLAAAAKEVPENVVPMSSPNRVRRLLPLAAAICALAGIASVFYVNGLVQYKASRSAKEGDALLARLKEMQLSEPEESRSEAKHSDLKPDPRLAAAAAPAGAPADAPVDPQGYTERVNISGNTRTKDKVIHRESAVAPSDVFNSVRVAPEGPLVTSSSPAKAPAVTLAPPSATPPPATFADKLAPSGNEGLIASGTTLTKSGSGTMVLNGGNVGMGNASTAMPAEKPALVSTLAPSPTNHPRPAAAMPMRTRTAGRTADLAKDGTSSMGAPVTFDGQDERISQYEKQLEMARKEKNDLARPDAEHSTEAYDAITDNAFLAVRENPLSTFSIDVDTASYANVRRFLNQQTRPPKGAVRIEELLNYFTYDYPQPDGETPFSATMEVATCPWAPEHRLVRIGLKGREIAKDKRPASNLVFLIDVSGSMQPENKLPLLKKCLRMLVDQLTPEDTVSIAVYAGASGTVLEPTHDRGEIRAALDRLESGGSTNGAAGIQLAYRLAEQSFIKGGVNRVILATDGDFNVGVTSQSELTDLITRKAKKGTFLTVLGFGMGNLKDSTLEKLADKGNGNYAYIDTLNEGRKVLVEQMNGTLVTIAKDVKIQVEFNPAQVGAYRLIGYENRLLAKEDFNDDKKDAGEIGAGHTVTALYEVVPAGKAAPGVPSVDPLKYQTTGSKEPGTRNQEPGTSAELLTLKLRYKQPDGDTSKLLEFPLTDRGETWEKSSRDFRFAAAVAGFGMLLRESPHKGTATWESVRELAMEGRGEDRSGYRGEFLTLLDKAKALGR